MLWTTAKDSQTPHTGVRLCMFGTPALTRASRLRYSISWAYPNLHYRVPFLAWYAVFRFFSQGRKLALENPCHAIPWLILGRGSWAVNSRTPLQSSGRSSVLATPCICVFIRSCIAAIVPRRLAWPMCEHDRDPTSSKFTRSYG